MNARVLRHSAFEQDISDIGLAIARQSPDSAFRFFTAIEQSIDVLRFMPEKGSLKRIRGTTGIAVRSWHVAGFRKYLILYEVRESDVFLFTVVHGARRYGSLLRSRGV